MQDRPRWPTPPCLDLSLMIRAREHPAIGLHRGWCAARAGLPTDASETQAWKEGWALYWRVQWFGTGCLPS